MSRTTVAGLRKRAHLLRVGAWFSLCCMGVLTGAAWAVDETLVSSCASSAVSMALFFWGFFTASTDLYEKAARLRQRNAELLKLKGFDRG